MEDMVKKVIDFILFLVNAIKEMVQKLSGRAPADDATTAAAEE